MRPFSLTCLVVLVLLDALSYTCSSTCSLPALFFVHQNVLLRTHFSEHKPTGWQGQVGHSFYRFWPAKIAAGQIKPLNFSGSLVPSSFSTCCHRSQTKPLNFFGSLVPPSFSTCCHRSQMKPLNFIGSLQNPHPPPRSKLYNMFQTGWGARQRSLPRIIHCPT